MLAASAGNTDLKIAADLHVSRPSVVLWRERFSQQGLECVWRIAPGRGRKPTYDADRVKQILAATLQSKPKGMSHWSCRLMAKQQGASKSTISNIWRSHNLKPHRVKRFKLSRDPKFLEKLTDVVGLYLNPPQQAIVLCVDERSQIQALNRTQPGWPLKKGRCGTMTPDYKHHGTTTLFAALEIAPGQGGRPLPATPSPSGVLEVSDHPRSGVSRPGSLALGDGQLRQPQASQRPSLAAAASPLLLPLRAHQLQLAQSDRTLVR